MKIKNIDELIEKYNFQSGDILLFEHIDTKQNNSVSDYIFNFIDNTIKYFTKSKYNHVGMIIKDPSWNKNLKGYYLLESNSEPIKDSEDHEKKFGVQLVSLRFILSEKYNHLYWRKLNCVRDENFIKKLSEAHSIVHNKPYDLNIIDWLKAGLLNDHKIKDKDHEKSVHKTNTFWCSALVSFMFVKLGFLDKNTPWSIISPKELGTENKNCLQFINCKLDKEIKIT